MNFFSRQAGSVLPPADAYLFDIDGTLLNSRDGVHYNAFHAAVREVYGIDSKIDGVPVHGNTDLGILRAVARRAGLSDSEFESKLPAAIDCMCATAADNAGGMAPELCPSIRELLGALRQAGKLLGVVSGNLEPIGWMKLQAAGIKQFFAFGSFSNQRELRRDIFRHGMEQAKQRLGATARVCFVGDTPSDIEAAREIGSPVLAVATGIFSVADLLVHKPDACVGCCSELVGGRKK
ncbi:MAG TPA: HAD family hydrolase [Terriglobales bacterium]|nr:HAD family hydrolase [Terriglobales bacterium]